MGTGHPLAGPPGAYCAWDARGSVQVMRPPFMAQGLGSGGRQCTQKETVGRVGLLLLSPTKVEEIPSPPPQVPLFFLF